MLPNPELPEWNTGEVLTQAKIEKLTNAIRWLRERQPHTLSMQGKILTQGQVCISGYAEIDPDTYPGYQHAGERYGVFPLPFPPVLSSLRNVQLQPQYGSNAALLATVSNESEDGVLVVVCDAGGTPISDPFGLWITASGPAAGVLPNGLTPDFWPPFSGHPVSAYWLNRLGQTISYQHLAVPYYRNTDGAAWVGSYGIGEVVGYLLVDPATYPGYNGSGYHWGTYSVSLPPVFSQLIGLSIQAASGANGAILATVNNATTSGFTVFVWDSGLTPIQVHALWIRARGLLASGVLPITPQNRGFSLTEATSSTPLSSTLLQSYSDACHYRLRRTACLFDLDGDSLNAGGGFGLLEGYVYVDPYTYPGYVGAGARYGGYSVFFPEGLFEQLLYIRVQPASSTNTWMTASVSNEREGSVTVFVWDVGGTPIQGHALWLEAIGRLKAGVLP